MFDVLTVIKTNERKEEKEEGLHSNGGVCGGYMVKILVTGVIECMKQKSPESSAERYGILNMNSMLNFRQKVGTWNQKKCNQSTICNTQDKRKKPLFSV